MVKDEHKLPIGDIVAGKWKVLDKLGEGAFGAVYKVVDVRASSNDEYAMKVESTKVDEPMLKMESAVLKTFRSQKAPQPHVCQYVESGGTGRLWFVVMELVGRSVADLRRACLNGRFSESTATRIEMQSIEAIEALHRIGFVHRDIKPANFAMGRSGPNVRTVYLLDFGLARQYLTPDGQVRPARSAAGFRGTVRYAPINTHLRKDLGRQDDLWSWFYMTVEFHKGELPWKKDRDKDEVKKKKQEISAEQLLSGMEMEYRAMMKDLQGLKFEDTPNYSWFHQQLRSIAIRRRFRDSDPFDWEAGGTGYESVLKSAISPDPYKKKEKADQKVVKEKLEGEEEGT